MANILPWQYSRIQVRGIVVRTASVALVLLLSTSFDNDQAYAAEGAFGGFPFVVHCEGNGSHRFYYLSKIGPDGIAVYLSPDNQAGTIAIGGKAERVVPGLTGNCAGKTLEQLRSAGQTYDLKH